LVVRGLVKLIALAKFLTVGQEISPKTHQHFIPGLVVAKQRKKLTDDISLII
jgi:hypothetical protein